MHFTGSDSCLGIHLVNRVKSFNGLQEGKAYSLKDTWLKLPSPIPPVELESEEMSKAEKNTVEYLEKLLRQAVDSGIVTFATVSGGEAYDGTQMNMDLGNETLVINGLQIGGDKEAITHMHPDDIKMSIDRVYGDEEQTEENRLAALQMMRKDNRLLEPLQYGNYIRNYAAAMGVTPVQPVGGESPAERERIANNYQTVRMKLCAWMLSMYPEHLCLVEKNLAAFTYLREKEQLLEQAIDKKNRVYKLAEQFCLPMVAGKLTLDVTTFCVDNHGRPLELFDNDMNRFNRAELKYMEAAFLMQYEEHTPEFTPAMVQLVQSTIDHFPRTFRELRKTGVLAEIEGTMYASRGRWQELAVDIESNMSMDILRRDAMLKIYKTLYSVINEIIEQYEIWKGTAAQTVPPVEPVAPVTPPVVKEEPPKPANPEFPQAMIDAICAMPHAQKVAMLKNFPLEKRVALLGLLPADQVAEVTPELF